MRHSTRIITVLTLAVPAVGITGLYVARPASAQVQPHLAARVTIEGFSFSPKILTIKPGTTVVWTQKDQAPHTITSNTGAWVSSADLSSGQTFTRTFTKAGTFVYHCGVHPGMIAKVIVSSQPPTSQSTADTPTPTSQSYDGEGGQGHDDNRTTPEPTSQGYYGDDHGHDDNRATPEPTASSQGGGSESHGGGHGHGGRDG